jgi:hypothetical protein
LTEAAVRDRNFSLRYTNFKTIRIQKNLEPVLGPKDVVAKPVEASSFDDIIRDSYLTEIDASDEKEAKEMKTIRELIRKLGKNTQIDDLHVANVDPQRGVISKHMVELGVEFESGQHDRIAFPTTTLLRKRSNNEYVLSPAGELTVGDEVVYIETSLRESVDSFLLKDYLAENQISLEQVFEPLTCLKSFCDSLRNLVVNQEYSDTKLLNLYWLNSTQRQILYKLVQSLLKGRYLTLEDEFFAETKNDNIWSDFITPAALIKIFSQKNHKITLDLLYNIVNKAGLTLAPGSFKAYSSVGSAGTKHYFFNNERDMHALGLLTGNKNLIENFDVINEHGRQLTRLLQIIGNSVSRVARGKPNPLNEMDVIIENSMKQCKVTRIQRRVS